ncbi:hypothetical protein [Azospirillum doebereinerae]|nr:hypothetical protein [Azospirillum doebereinerae]
MSNHLKELKVAAQAIHSPLDTVAEILEREAIAIRRSLAEAAGQGGRP